MQEKKRTYVVNLRRRPDRLALALTEFDQIGVAPTVFEAVDGWSAKIPSTWKAGRGSFGCCQSHRLILAECLRDGVSEVMVCEDDITFTENFNTKLSAFLAEVPSDWQGLLLGGQHLSAPTYVSPGVVQCGGRRGCHRTHSYIVRGSYIQTLHDIFANATTHIDKAWSAVQRHHRVYAPFPTWLACQRESHSDINGRDNGEKCWQPKMVMGAPSTTRGLIRRVAPCRKCGRK